MNKTTGYLLLLFILFFTTQSAFAQSQTVSGIVFHDKNNNGLQDGDENGIAGVSVSNGLDVVQTDASGRYELPVQDDTIIFVIKPGNFNYPVNVLNMTQFYYVHKPDGSPELRYKGVAPTGALPASVNFPLISGRENDEFSILVFGDPQPYNEIEVGYYDRHIVEPLIGIKGFDFGISLGDLVGDNLDLFEPLNNATARIGTPWFHVIGNHDINFDVKERKHSDETFERVYGPANYAFNHGKVFFIVLNDVIYPNPYDDRNYVGGLEADQIRFVENALKHVPEDYLVVISVHIPIFDEAPFGETFKDDHRRSLFEALKDRPFTMSMSGHTHTQRHHFFNETDGWLRDKPHHHYNAGTASGDWWSGEFDERGIPSAQMRDGTPNGYAKIHFKGNQYAIDYVVSGDEEQKMHVYGPKNVPQGRLFRGEFYVNYYNGSEHCSVEFRVPGEDWRPMTHTISEDPVINALRLKWDAAEVIPAGKRPSNPVLSNHLWKARVPSSMDAGEQLLEIRVTDFFGNVHFSAFKYTIVAP